jgi:hypothetical protein
VVRAFADITPVAVFREQAAFAIASEYEIVPGPLEVAATFGVTAPALKEFVVFVGVQETIWSALKLKFEVLVAPPRKKSIACAVAVIWQNPIAIQDITPVVESTVQPVVPAFATE